MGSERLTGALRDGLPHRVHVIKAKRAELSPGGATRRLRRQSGGLARASDAAGFQLLDALAAWARGVEQ